MTAFRRARMAYRNNINTPPRGPKHWSSPTRGSQYRPAPMTSSWEDGKMFRRSELDYGRPSWMHAGGQAAVSVPARPAAQPHMHVMPSPNQLRVVRLTKETRAAMGSQTNKHTHCVRCWQPASLDHRRRWLECTGKCPACDDEHQHWGQVSKLHPYGTWLMS